jgi:CHAT domain-containing protein
MCRLVIVAVSRMIAYQWECAGCARRQEAPVWQILDVGERPDATEFMTPGLMHVWCSDCGARALIRSTMLLIRPGDPVPLLLGIAGGGEPIARSEAIGMQLAQEAWAAGAAENFVGPMIPLPRLLLILPLTRDVVADATDPEPFLQLLQGADEQVAGWYQEFLEQVRSSEPTRRADRALRELAGIPPDRLAEFLDSHPELGEPAALERVTDELAAGGRPDTELLQARVQLVQSLAAGIPAQKVAADYVRALEQFGRVLNERYQRLLDLARDHPGPDGVPQAREALAMAVALGHQEPEAELSAELALRLLLGTGSDGPNLEEAIGLLRHALTLIPESDPRWPAWAGNLAAAYHRRTTGDLTETWEAARALLERACAATDRAANPRTWAINQTNYGLLLSERPGGPAEGDLTSGIEHLLAGMEERSPQANAVDWAYSQLNLGLLHSRRAEAGDLETAAECYRQALAHLRAADQPQLWATLQNNLADVLLSLPVPDPAAAAKAAWAALDVARANGDRLTAARVGWTLGRAEDAIHGQLSGEAIQPRRDALGLLEPAQAPDLYRRIGGELVDAYSQLGRWDAAADVYQGMLTAFGALYDAQVTGEARREVLTRSPNLARWAAYALARAGRTELAVEAIENGRTRQLSASLARESADLARLAAADPHLADQYRQALAEFRSALADAGQTLAGAAVQDRIVAAERAIQLLLQQIRGIPGLERFLRPMSVADIGAVGQGDPVIYLVSAPGGSYVLTVRPGQMGAPVVDATAVPEVTSTDVLKVVLFDYQDRIAPGLISAQSAGALRRASLLPAALNRLGELQPLVQPVADVLTRSASHRAIVIPTGLLGLIPLHAIPLPPGDSQVLDDAGEVYLAPSAAVFAACRKRAATPRAEHLVGLADPESGPRSLPGSRAELTAIQAMFRTHGPVTCALGPDATRGWLLQHVGQASHLHMGCHGASAPGSTADGKLYLAAATTLTIGDLIDGRLEGCRLAIASACQSGHYATAGVADEFAGLPAGFLQSGASCAIVSLWQVNDRVTAILMTRLYELLLSPARDTANAPIAALRQARAWLRHLTAEQLAAFIQEHPPLAGISGLPQLQTPGTASTCPYTAPQYWAAFTAWGT